MAPRGRTCELYTWLGFLIEAQLVGQFFLYQLAIPSGKCLYFPYNNVTTI